MSIDAPARLLAAPRWMLVIDGAAVMFCGQIIWDLLATWSTGPSPGLKPDGLQPSVPLTEVSSRSCAAAALVRQRLPTLETWQQKSQCAPIDGPDAKGSELLPRRWQTSVLAQQG